MVNISQIITLRSDLVEKAIFSSILFGDTVNVNNVARKSTIQKDVSGEQAWKRSLAAPC